MNPCIFLLVQRTEISTLPHNNLPGVISCKYFGALHLLNSGQVVMFYKYCGALHLMSPVLLVFYKYCSALHLMNYGLVMVFKYFGQLHQSIKN